MLPKILTDASLTPDDLVIDDNVWARIVRPLGFDPGIRTLQRTVQGLVRKVMRYALEGKIKQENGPFKITLENVKEFLPA